MILIQSLNPIAVSLRAVVVVASAAFALGFAAAAAQSRHVAHDTQAIKSPAAFAPEPAPYFLAQYELNAGPPEEHIQAF